MTHLGTGALRSPRTAESSASIKLSSSFVSKPWGCTRLPNIFGAPEGDRIGEVWFTADYDLPLLAKYLFTSEALSVQVHPDDEQARLHGLPCGKSECWYVLNAEPGAAIGLGLRSEVTRQTLLEAVLDGSVEQLIDWRLVAADDFFYVPPGTIHAIGAGICLLEFQQNSDVTYRLYDYGRPRKLHLSEAMAVAQLGRYPDHLYRPVAPIEDSVLVEGPQFTLVHTHADALQDRRRWILPLDGFARCGAEVASAGECLLVSPHGTLDEVQGRLLIGAAAEY